MQSLSFRTGEKLRNNQWTDFFENWDHQSPANARLVAQELLITEVTESIWKAMEDAGLTRPNWLGGWTATKGYVVSGVERVA